MNGVRQIRIRHYAVVYQQREREREKKKRGKEGRQEGREGGKEEEPLAVTSTQKHITNLTVIKL